MIKMEYTSKYHSPLGEILIAADEIGITGLWFEGQKYFPSEEKQIEKETKLLKDTKKWLDIYFSGKSPTFQLPLHFTGNSFQNEVWKILCNIPYGKTTTYGEIVKMLAKKKERKSMSAQAVGGAVGRNKISILVPCHRVIGKNGDLVGYAGGLDKKMELLKLEKSYQNRKSGIQLCDTIEESSSNI